jgi:signal transduction histidine kinase
MTDSSAGVDGARWNPDAPWSGAALKGHAQMGRITVAEETTSDVELMTTPVGTRRGPDRRCPDGFVSAGEAMLQRTSTTAAWFGDAGGDHVPEVRFSRETETAEKRHAPRVFPLMGLRPGDAGLAFTVGAGWFAFCTLLASLSAFSSQLLLAITITTLDVVVVATLARAQGVGYGMTVGVAGAVALDWYCIPPVHDHGLPDAQNALALCAYLLAAALLGQLAAEARRRAKESEFQARVLASEQAALRRVATLIATKSPPDRVFEVVTHEVGELLGLDLTALLRYESDETATVAGRWSRVGPQPRLGSRWAWRRDTFACVVRDTRRPGRVADLAERQAPLDSLMQQVGARSSVASPVVVNGSLWGVMIGASVADEPLAQGIELRLGDFTELAATAVANADSRHELAASRARIVTSSNQARKEIERDLHDGVQQRLVSLALDVRHAEALVGRTQVDLREQLEELRIGLVSAVDNLREIAHGIHPSILADGGLRPALARLARRSPIPIELSVRGLDRVPDPLEICVYYVVSEALTNALKHAQATKVSIDLELGDSAIKLVVRDDGVGGADTRTGTGLVGLIDRLQALGGAIEVHSPAQLGTRLTVRIPVVGTTDDR